MEFQILDWKAFDFDTEIDDDDDNNNGEENESKKCKKYVIKAFGLNENRETVSVTICDFTPYFYIKPKHNKLTRHELADLEAHLDSQLPFNLKGSIKNLKVMRKKDMWGFNNDTVFPFIRITFINIISMKLCVKYLSKAIKLRNKMYKYTLYENNIEPYIRFLHCKDINPCGWIKLDGSKTFRNKIKKTNCQYDFAIKWSYVESLPQKEIISPLIVASFDIECTSSHGDFPLAIKKYEKTTREMIQACSLFKNERIPIVKKFIKDSLLHIFNVEEIEEMKTYYTKVYFKNPDIIVTSKFILKIIDTVYDIIVTNNIHTVKSFTNIYEYPDDEQTTFKNAFKREFMKVSDNNNVENKTKEPTFLQLNTFLTETFHAVEGDSIIQIGTTFHKYGSTNCFYKHVITLNTCDDIVGIDDIVQCNNEQDVLLEWTKLILRIDPDIMTGYNIFGFDFQFMYDRSTEIGCSKEFCQLGRYKNHRSEIVHKCLSSSALGDNYLHYIDMEGRVLIDLMKVIQRDHNLDSYKLENVASHFIQGNIQSINGTKLKVDNILGLQVDSYINLKNDTISNKYLITEIDTIHNVIHVDCEITNTYTKWGLAKDDVTPNEIFECQKGTSSDRARIAKYCV